MIQKLLSVFMLCSVLVAQEEISMSKSSKPSKQESYNFQPEPAAPEPHHFQPQIEPVTSELTPPQDPHSSFRIGGAYSYAWITPEGKSTFKGNLYGAQGIYEYRPVKSFYAGVKFAYREGKTDQDLNSRSLLYFDAHERIGYTFGGCESKARASFYTGLGYRYIGQTLKQPGLANLIFNYNEFYVPVGFAYEKTCNSCFSYGLNATWMPQAFPTVVLNPLGGANWIIKRTFANFIVEAPLTFTLCGCNHVTLELKPFFEYWQDGKTVAESPEGVPLTVPQNTYLFPGVELNLGADF